MGVSQQEPSLVFLNLQIEIEGSDEKTLIKNQKASFDERGNLFLAPLLQQVKQSGFDQLTNATVKYYSWQDMAFVLVGIDPIREDFSIPVKELHVDQPLRIRIRQSQSGDRGRTLTSTNSLSAVAKVQTPEEPISSRASQQKMHQKLLESKEQTKRNEEIKEDGRASTRRSATKKEPSSTGNSANKMMNDDSNDSMVSVWRQNLNISN